MQKPAMIQVLEDAQLAHQAGDFVNALKFYEQFFDHALDDDPYALYGVRLSYCLKGWADLAKQYPFAKDRLAQKQQETLSDYLRNGRPETFHDYYSISAVLNETNAALEQFLHLNTKNKESAAQLVKYVWDDLVSAENWQVCGQFLEDPTQKLDEAFAMFDEAKRLAEIDQRFDTAEFEAHMIDALIKSTSELVLILRRNNRKEDAEKINRKFFESAHQKNHTGLNRVINSKGAFLFGSH